MGGVETCGVDTFIIPQYTAPLGRRDPRPRTPTNWMPQHAGMAFFVAIVFLLGAGSCPSPATASPLRDKPNGRNGGDGYHNAAGVASAVGRIAESNDPAAAAKAEAEAVLNRLTNSSAARRHACVTIANIACERIPLPQAQNLCREHAKAQW